MVPSGLFPLNSAGRQTPAGLRVSGESLHRLGVGLSPLLNGVSEQELLHLHQAYGVGPLVFVQLHGDIFDIFLHLRDLYILQGID